MNEPRDASLQLAAEMLRQANEFAQFNAALNQLNGPLAKQGGIVKSLFDDKTRQLFQELYQPDAAELEALESSLSRPLDAAHLQGCFLFRDAARSLEVTGLAPLGQALLGCTWVMRRVLLHEQQDSGLPPHLVLRRGFGGVSDRALVTLELMQQWKIDGCLLALPKKDGGDDLLVGIFVPKKEGIDVALFDPRLGLPIAGPQGTATLAEVRAKPELLQPSGIAAEQLKAIVARPACSLTALAPRMKAIEDLLRGHEQVVLYHDVAEQQRRLSAANLTFAGWPPKDKQAPGRRLALFHGKEEGGVDVELRLARFTFSSILPPAVIQKYEQMRVLRDLQSEAAQEMLTQKITVTLFQRYEVEPRMALLRGRHDDAIRRVDRISNVVDDAAFAMQIPEAEFNQLIAKWRERVMDAYRASEANGKTIWLEDQYLWSLLQPDDMVNPSRLRREMLSQIVLRACREPLGNQADAIKAACWEDRALKLEALAEARRQTGKPKAGQDATSAWKNARSAWVKLLDRSDVTELQMRHRMEAVSAQVRQGQRELALSMALSMCEQIHLDLHNALEARLRLAEINRRLGQINTSRGDFTKLRDDLTTLPKAEQPRKFLQETLELARGSAGNAQHVHRLELLLRDWAPDGHLASQRQTVERHLETMK